MAKWEELPIADRAKYMEIAVKNGYRDIRSIKEAYNQYAKGGPKDGYKEWLENEALQNSKLWGVSYDEALNQMKNDKSYNYRKFYELQKANPDNPEYQRDLEGNAHYNDVGKSVYHPTASTGSYYSGKKDPKWNPTGAKFGEWLNNGHEYRMSDDMLRVGASPYDTMNYLSEAEDKGVRLRDQRGLMFRDYREPEETYIEGVLPEVTITEKKKHSNGGNLFETGGTKNDNRKKTKYSPETMSGFITSLFTDNDKIIAGADVGSSTFNMSADAIPVVGNIAGAVISIGDALYNAGKFIADPSWSQLAETGLSYAGIVPGVGNINDAKKVAKGLTHMAKNVSKAGVKKGIKNTITRRHTGRPKAKVNTLDSKGNIVSSYREPLFDYSTPYLKALGTVGNLGYSLEDMYSGTSELYNTYNNQGKTQNAYKPFINIKKNGGKLLKDKVSKCRMMTKL